MRHQRNRHKLSRDSAHRKALLMNLSKELIDHERIQTTTAKAKAVKPEVERLITLAKRGDLHARRQALSALGQDKFVVYKLFEEIAPRYAERPGGYTRILKLGPRKSDATEMARREPVWRRRHGRCRRQPAEAALRRGLGPRGLRAHSPPDPARLPSARRRVRHLRGPGGARRRGRQRQPHRAG